MKHSRPNLAIYAVALLAAASGCSDGPVSIGDQQPSAQLKTGLAAFAASWDGYVQAYNFTDGSGKVRITVNEDGTGTVRFGNDALLPTPTDPNAKFPPDFPQCQWGCYLANAMPDVWDGFLFSLNGVRVETERLRATAMNKEVFADWCKLKTSHQLSGANTGGFTGYSCSACAGNSGADDGTVSDNCTKPKSCPAYVDATPLDAGTDFAWVPSLCERELLCMGSNGTVVAEVDQTCVCDANGCGIGTPAQNIILDAVLADGQKTLTGTLALPKAAGTEITNYTIVLKRQ